MAYGIAFERKGNAVEGRFGGEWSERCEFHPKPALIQKLGKHIIALAKGRKKSFLLSLEEKEGGLTVHGESKRFRGSILISFEFDGENPSFHVPCHNRFNYDGFSKEELVDFGHKLLDFNTTGCARIGDENIKEFARSFEEELLL